MKIISIQHDIRPDIPHIFCNIDYKNFRESLIKIDEILTKTKLEDQLIEAAIQKWLDSSDKSLAEFMNTSAYPKLWKYYQFALRCNIAGILTGESFRQFRACPKNWVFGTGSK